MRLPQPGLVLASLHPRWRGSPEWPGCALLIGEGVLEVCYSLGGGASYAFVDSSHPVVRGRKTVNLFRIRHTPSSAKKYIWLPIDCMRPTWRSRFYVGYEVPAYVIGLAPYVEGS